MPKQLLVSATAVVWAHHATLPTIPVKETKWLLTQKCLLNKNHTFVDLLFAFLSKSLLHTNVCFRARCPNQCGSH